MREFFDKSLLYDTLFINVTSISNYKNASELKNCECDQYYNIAAYCNEKNLNIGAYCDRNLYKLPEYSKIVGITYGIVTNDGTKLKRDIKHLNGDELSILKEFAEVLEYYYSIGMKSSPHYTYPICGLNLHNHELPLLFKKYLKYKIENGENITFPNHLRTYNDKSIDNDYNIIDIFKSYSNNYKQPVSIFDMCSYLDLKYQNGVVQPHDLNAKYWDLEGDVAKQQELIKLNSTNYINICIQYLNKLRQI